MMTLSHYTGGTGGYGTMQIECADCGEVVAEYNCDNGKPTDCIFDIRDTHECPEEEEEQEEEVEEECENYEYEDEIIDFDKE